MKRYKFILSIICFLIMILEITGCGPSFGFYYKKYAVLKMTETETEYETEKAEKYLKEKHPEDEFSIENIISEAWPEFKYPVYTINCIDKTQNIKFYIRDREKQLREPLKDNLEFCVNNKMQKAPNMQERNTEINTEIGKYFDTTNIANYGNSITTDDVDGGETHVTFQVTGKEISQNDFKDKTDKIISYLKIYKEIGFMAYYRYTDSNGVKRYHLRKYFTNTKTDTVQYAVKDK